jgi:tripartite-type tricarboxylate transporter receptor subunit TctC
MYASPGVGTPHHLAGSLLGARAGVDLVHVAYKGSPQAMTDLVAGQIQIGFEYATIAQPLVQAGKLRALAIAGPARKPLLPDVPTLAESGFPDFEIFGWFGFFAPKGTPLEVLERLHRELVKAMAEQDYVDYVHGLGSEVMTNTPEEFAAFLDAERSKWARIVKISGAKLE